MQRSERKFRMLRDGVMPYGRNLRYTSFNLDYIPRSRPRNKELSEGDSLIEQIFDGAFKELNQLREEMERANLEPAMRNSSLNLIKTYTEIVAHLRKGLKGSSLRAN